MLPIPCIVAGALVGARLNTAFTVQFAVNVPLYTFPTPVPPHVLPVQLENVPAVGSAMQE